MLSFDIEQIAIGSSFIMNLLKKENDIDKKFLEKNINEILSLLLELHTKIFEDGINY